MEEISSVKTSHGLECIFLNPAGIEQYVPMVKIGLLYFDRIFLNPAIDFVCEISPNLPEILEQISTPILQNGLLSFKNEATNIVNRNPRLRRRQEALKKALAKKTFKKMEKKFNNKLLQKKAELEVEEKDKRIKEIKDELKPAEDSGYVYYNLKDIHEKDVEDIAGEVAYPFRDTILNIYKSALGLEVADTCSTEKDPFKLWATIAANLTAKLDCPLMTSTSGFMKYLNENYKNIQPSKHLEPFLAEKRWKAQQLSFQLCELELPDPREIPIEDILEVRRLADDVLSEYREKMKTYARTLRLAPWDPDFEHEAASVIEDDIRPVLREAEKIFTREPKILEIFKRSYARAGQITAGYGAVSLAANIFSLPESILIGTVGFGALLKGFEKFLEELYQSIYMPNPDSAAYNGFIFMVKARAILR